MLNFGAIGESPMRKFDFQAKKVQVVIGHFIQPIKSCSMLIREAL